MADDRAITALEDIRNEAEVFGWSSAHANRLLVAVGRVLELCRDTDGNYLPPEAEVPVGEFVAAISAALLGEGADGG